LKQNNPTLVKMLLWLMYSCQSDRLPAKTKKKKAAQQKFSKLLCSSNNQAKYDYSIKKGFQTAPQHINLVSVRIF